MFNNAICNSGLECVGMSAELLTQAIEGKDIDGLQDKLITIIKSAEYRFCTLLAYSSSYPVGFQSN
jgi:hypothetical protein